jgi:adenine-specific DNA-methyltransferase
LRAAQTPTTATLKPDFANAKDWDTTQNVFIEGDNLEVLKILQRHYHNKIKLIYIDPPYNTGKDFVYPDNYVEGLQTYLEWTRQVNEEGKKVSSNSESEGRYHSNWLNMMYPRLKLARNLLTDDGVIFISIDDHEQENLKRLTSEVFGESNFIGTLIWDTNHSAQSGVFKVYHQYVHVYARSKGQIFAPEIGDGERFEAGAQKRPSVRHSVSEFTFPAGTRWEVPDNTEFTDEWGEVERTILKQGRMIACNGVLVEPVILAAAWTQRGQMQQYFYGDRNSLVDSRGQKIVEFYFSSSGKIKIVKERGVITPSTVRHEYGSQNTISTTLAELFEKGASPLDSPKPPAMIEEFASWFSTGNDIILDFFAGSATTAHAVMKLNAEDGGTRRFIMVQLPEPMPEDSEARRAGFETIADISRKRIELAGEKIKADNPTAAQELDTGFRAYKLADTNFAKWRVTSEITPDELEQHLLDLRDSAADEATADDLLTEILLKMGFPLTAKITATEIAELEVRWVGTDKGERLVLAYLDRHIKPTLEQLRGLVAAEPPCLVILEDAFHGDDELKANLAQLCKSRNIELWTA